MTRRKRTQCEIGIPEVAIRNAMATWDRLARDGKTFAATVSGYIAALPKYPTPGTAEYSRCIQKWMTAYMQAQMMDNWLQQIGTLQGYLNGAQPILDALTAAYTDCMEGTPV